jgi:hypothetical protein
MGGCSGSIKEFSTDCKVHKGGDASGPPRSRKMKCTMNCYKLLLVPFIETEADEHTVLISSN